jgi:cytochrome c-type biogenesis protein CcmH
MMLWAILTVLTVVATVLVVIPLIRRLEQPKPASEADVAVYREQLRSLEADVQAGQMSADEAQSVRVEVQRRLLTAANTSTPPSQPLPDGLKLKLGVGLAAVVALAATGLYALTGSPEVPASPYEQAKAAVDSQVAQAADQQAQVGEVTAMISGLENRLKTNPDNAEGWRMLGWSYFQVGQYAKSVEAYGKSIAITDNAPAVRSAYGEALTMAAGGTVTGPAQEQFRRTLKDDPADPRARFYLGLAREQQGDKPGALKDWMALLQSAPADAAWVPDLRSRVVALGDELGIDVRSELGDAGAAAPASVPPPTLPGGALPAPPREAMEAAQAMTPADQAAMIRGMVDRLAQRLEENPRDADGWVRLMRSYMVLKDTAAAQTALNNGLKAFADAPTTQERLRADAQALGISAGN